MTNRNRHTIATTTDDRKGRTIPHNVRPSVRPPVCLSVNAPSRLLTHHTQSLHQPSSVDDVRNNQPTTGPTRCDMPLSRRWRLRRQRNVSFYQSGLQLNRFNSPHYPSDGTIIMRIFQRFPFSQHGSDRA